VNKIRLQQLSIDVTSHYRKGSKIPKAQITNRKIAEDESMEERYRYGNSVFGNDPRATNRTRAKSIDPTAKKSSIASGGNPQTTKISNLP
jgi:hypothetical protein